MALYFYELHEGSSDLTTDAILVSDRSYGAEAFADLVLEARRMVLDTFEEDTLVEAVARELERRHGFTYISDDMLRASVSVGIEDEDNYLVESSTEFRSLLVDLER